MWQFILAVHFCPWNSLLVNAGVWWWCTETTSFRERVQRIEEWVKNTPFRLADQEHVNTVQVVELVLKNHQDTINYLSMGLEWFVKSVPNIVHVQLGYSSVCAWWVPRNLMEDHNNLCLQVLFHFFSHLKEEQTGSWIHGDVVRHGFTILLKMSFNAVDTFIFIESHKM